MSTLDVLKLTPLPTHLMTALQARYQVHDHGHLIDPAAFTRVSVMVGTSEMKVDAKLLATYPHVRGCAWWVSVLIKWTWRRSKRAASL